MDNTPAILDFVKAVSHADRLRIIGVLARQPASIREVADRLGMPFRRAFGHLGMLEFAGVVHKQGELFVLDEAAVEHLQARQFADQRPTYIPDPALDVRTRKVLATFLNADGTLKQIPPSGARLQAVLNYLAAAFEPAVNYSEKEVNLILRRFYTDPVTLRRALIDAGMLAREPDGSRYWRTR